MLASRPSAGEGHPWLCPSSCKVVRKSNKKNKVVYGYMCDRGQEEVLDEDEKDDEEERGRR